MELASVRELKAMLAQSVLAPLTAEASPRTFALEAGPLERINRPLRSIALGVAVHGPSNFRLAVRYQRREMEQSKELDSIRKRAKGEADVRYIGRVTKSAAAVPWTQKRHRPLSIGTSIGHFKITAGTIGAFVTPRAGGDPLLLSNNHVLADENRGKIGDAILQPGAFDHGENPADAVATLSQMVKLKKTGTNLVDCALAAPAAGVKFNNRAIRGLGNLSGLGSEFLDTGTEVAKLGRTTGLTRGRVTAFELDNVVVAYDLGNLRFDNQIEIEGAAADAPFSRGGDSGSLIVDADRRAVALLFAGGEVGGSNGLGLTFANPIRAVLDALEVHLMF
jgi:hypothetical protein